MLKCRRIHVEYALKWMCVVYTNSTEIIINTKDAHPRLFICFYFFRLFGAAIQSNKYTKHICIYIEATWASKTTATTIFTLRFSLIYLNGANFSAEGSACGAQALWLGRYAMRRSICVDAQCRPRCVCVWGTAKSCCAGIEWRPSVDSFRDQRIHGANLVRMGSWEIYTYHSPYPSA